jgi:hypothetical protein
MRRICPECMKQFDTHRGLHIYCSRECKEKQRVRLMAHKEPKKRKYSFCQFCGETKEENYRKTCSDHCAKKWRALVRNKRAHELAKKFDKWKKSIGCGMCGYNKCGKALDFHHTDPSTKLFEINKLNWWSFITYDNERVKQEIDKCILLCANCHSEVMYCA